MAAPTGMEWKQYYDDYNSISDIMSGKAKPGVASILLGNVIDSFAGGPTDMGKSLGAGQPMFGAPATPSQPGAAPVVSGAVAPPAPGQPVTQPQYGAQQVPVPETQSYTRFLFAPK